MMTPTRTSGIHSGPSSIQGYWKLKKNKEHYQNVWNESKLIFKKVKNEDWHRLIHMSDLLFHLKLLLKLMLQNREYFKMSEIRQSFKLEKVKNEDRHRLIYMSNLLLNLPYWKLSVNWWYLSKPMPFISGLNPLFISSQNKYSEPHIDS